MQLELVPARMGVLARTAIVYERTNHACTALPILDIKTYLHDLLCHAHEFSLTLNQYQPVRTCLASHPLTNNVATRFPELCPL